MSNAKKTLPAWLILTVVTAAAGLLLGVTEALTTPVITQNAQAAADISRFAVFPEADSFEALALEENAPITDCYSALRGGEALGHVGSVTVKGYGGEIEVIAGVSLNGTVTGVSVGGANFSETAGLGARVKEPEFTAQFTGVSLPVALGDNVDAVTGASISSGAVVSAVNKIAAYISNIGKDISETDPYRYIMSMEMEYEALSHDGTVDAAYRTKDGYVVLASEQGYHGPIHVAVAFDAAGAITKVAIDQSEFSETAGLGERVLEGWFLAQFNGRNGVIGVQPGEKGDATSAATGQAGADATSEATGQAEADATSAATGQAGTDATSEATGQAGTDATSAATGQAGADATSEATTVVEVIEGADSVIDGVSGATISSTAVTKAVNAAVAFVQSLL